jgi:hypothetical protein
MLECPNEKVIIGYRILFLLRKLSTHGKAKLLLDVKMEIFTYLFPFYELINHVFH